MATLNEKMIARLQKMAARKTHDEDENVHDEDSNPDFDAGYKAGNKDGEAYLARKILSELGLLEEN